jgi:major membrane immunogen (membrane-anchored lipoprotein)
MKYRPIRVLALSVVLAVPALLVACGSSDQKPASSDPTTTTEVMTDKGKDGEMTDDTMTDKGASTSTTVDGSMTDEG